jgi:hypothetical protein
MISRRSRLLVAIAGSVVAAGGVPADLLSSHTAPAYGDVLLFLGLALVPLLALPTWRDSTSPVLGWIQLAYPVSYSLGFLWAGPAYPLTWLWPLFVFAGNLSFVAFWWLATIDTDGRLRNHLARTIVAVGTVLWVAVGLVIILCWVPRTGWTATDAYAAFPSPAAMRYLDEDWNAVTWTYVALLAAAAVLTIRFASTADSADRSIRWLIAVATTADAGWTIWTETPGSGTGSGLLGVFSTLEQFTAIVAIPYLVVLLTRPSRTVEVSSSAAAGATGLATAD